MNFFSVNGRKTVNCRCTKREKKDLLKIKKIRGRSAHLLARERKSGRGGGRVKKDRRMADMTAINGRLSRFFIADILFIADIH